MYKEILDKYGEEYILRQLAEECNELAQAALKYIRAKRGETPMRVDEAVEHLMEEMADVEVVLDAIRDVILTTDQINDVCGIAQAKLQRWISRMVDGDMDEEVW